MDLFSGELTITHAITASSLLVGGILLGALSYRLLRGRVQKAAALSTFGGDDIIVRALHDVLLVWFSIAGLYAAGRSLPLEPEASLWLGRIVVSVLILSATLVAARVAGDSLRRWAHGDDDSSRGPTIFVALARIVVWIVGILVLLQTLGVSVTPILTALGVGGIAVALALQDTLSNLFAGIQILATRKVRPGEYVRLDTGQEGYITDITWRYTTLRQLPDNAVIVPNAKFAQAIVTNFYGPVRDLSITIELGVAFASDLPTVERVTLEVATEVLREVQGGVAGFEPMIRFLRFGESDIRFNVVLRAAEFADQFLIRHEFLKRIHERYRREGIEIPFPVRTVKLEGSA